MKRPSDLIAARRASSLAGLPSLATETSIVVGVQPAGAPIQVSRKKAPDLLMVFGTRFVALESKATYRPLAEMVGDRLLPLGSDPSFATETRIVAGVQPAGAPRQVSRT
jgi:hypothetical protein